MTSISRNDQPPPAPKLIWACCLGVYEGDPPCQVGICGLPEDLKDIDEHSPDQVTAVEQHFMNNQVAAEKIAKFLQTFKTPSTNTNAISSPSAPAKK